MQQVIQAMRCVGNGDEHARPLLAVVERPVKAEAFGNRIEHSAERRFIIAKARAARLEHDPHEKPAGIKVGILLTIDNEAIDLCQCTGNSRHNAHLIRTGEGQYPLTLRQGGLRVRALFWFRQDQHTLVEISASIGHSPFGLVKIALAPLRHTGFFKNTFAPWSFAR